MLRRGFLGATLALPCIQPARADASVRFALDWALQGNHGMWALAEDRGVFRREGLAVRMDRGFGSGDTIVKLASGAYDLAFADVNPVVKFNAENPDKRLVSIYQVFDRTAASVISVKGRGIDRISDIPGKTFGGSEGEGSRLLFPVFARAAGIDARTVNWKSVSPNLRDTLLAQGQVDAVTGFLFTSYFNLVGVGVREENIVSFPYAENGLDLYGSAVLCRADWLERNGDTARRFVKASIEGLQMLMADIPGGMASLKHREPLFDSDLEARRFAMTRDRSIVTPNTRAHGIGVLDMDRARLLVQTNSAAYGLSSPPIAESLFTSQYLPSEGARRL